MRVFLFWCMKLANHSLAVFCLAAALGVACSEKKTASTEPAYVKEIDDWHAYRVEVLKSPTGWLNIAGLFWLKEGMNSFGSDPSNSVVFPANFPIASVGFFVLENEQVRQTLLPGIQVTSKGGTVTGTTVIFHPDSARQPAMEYGDFRWFIIKRDTRYGVRLRDLNHPDLTGFRGIERFPVDVSWRVTARWKETPNRSIPITNVLGQTTPQSAPGTLVFSLQGRELSLDALDEGEDRLFIIFADKTNTRGTYGAGRYLYVSKPDSSGNVVVDFNKAENPPCAFTEFATCPLPPKQNVMDIEVTAGEKDYGHH